MAKKADAKKLNVFTEEELKELELDDDGVLEVDFIQDEPKKKEAPKPSKHDKPNKPVSDLDKRVAAIIKKLDLEDAEESHNEFEEKTKAMDEAEFNKLIEEAENAIEQEIDKVSSIKEAEKLRKKFNIGDNLKKLRELADRIDPYSFENPEFVQYDIDYLKKKLKGNNDIHEREKIKKELRKLENRKAELEQMYTAHTMLMKLKRAESCVAEANGSRLEDDIRELYQKYGVEAIEKLVNEGLEEQAV